MILPPATLTPSGRPQLSASEVERMLLDKVDLEFEGHGGTQGCPTAERYQGGYAVITSQRLIWIDSTASPAAGRSCHLSLDCIHSSRKHVQYGLNLINPKVRLEVKVYVDLTAKPSTLTDSTAFRHLQLRCRGEGPDAFSEQLNAALQAHQHQLEQQRRQQQRHQQQQAQQLVEQLSASHQWQQRQHDQLPQQHIPWLGSSSVGLRPQEWGTGGATGSSSSSTAGRAAPLSVQQQQQQQQAPMPARLAAQIQAVDVELLTTLTDMGFPRPRVLRALVATQSEHLQAALDWILAAGDEPGADDPFTGPEPSAVSRQELQQLRQLQERASGHYQQQQQQQSLPPPLLHCPSPSAGWSLGSMGASSGGGAAFVTDVIPMSGGYASSGGGGAAAAGHRGSGGGVIGVAGIMHREAAKTSQTSASLAVAFQDLDKLMDMAAEMVKLAEKFRGVMGPEGAITLSHPVSSGAGVSSSSSSSTLAGDAELLLDADTQLQLIAMGISSPVTKASAGSRYQQELSRQLADFLTGPLSRAGGVLLLPDVYCLFNRARGTELVSPDDLVQACQAFQEVGLPLRLRKFPSGVVVVQGSQFSDAQLCKSLAQLLQTTPADEGAVYNAAAVVPRLGPSLTASAVSAALSLPLTLAKEALLVGEAAGVLCRDDGPEGLRFFRNFYKEAQPVAF